MVGETEQASHPERSDILSLNGSAHRSLVNAFLARTPHSRFINSDFQVLIIVQ